VWGGVVDFMVFHRNCTITGHGRGEESAEPDREGGGMGNLGIGGREGDTT